MGVMTAMPAPYRKIFVDFAPIGRASVFSRTFWPEEIADFHLGDVVSVVGDAVEPRLAKVIDVNEAAGSVRFELIDAGEFGEVA